jgi:hypothetical protein
MQLMTDIIIVIGYLLIGDVYGFIWILIFKTDHRVFK